MNPARSRVVSLGLGLSLVAVLPSGCSSTDGEMDAGGVGSDAGVPPAPPPLPTSFQVCAGIGVTGVAQFAVSPDGGDLAVTTHSGQLIVLDSGTGERRRTFWELEGVQSAVAFSRRGDVLIAANHDKVRAWSHPDGEPILALDGPHPAPVDRLDLSPDQTLLATGAIHAEGPAGLVVHLWSFPQGARVATLTLTRIDGKVAAPLFLATR